MAAKHSISERFWSKVDRREPGECWEWQGTRGTKDYGSISANVDGRSKTWRAHRLSFLLANGYVPGLVMHTCDNPPCVNPAHLKAGTYRDNVLDARDKGRLNPHNARKTHCAKGHPYDDENTSIRNGVERQRVCRECHRAWRRAHRATVIETYRARDRARQKQIREQASAAGMTYRQYLADRRKQSDEASE